MNDLVHLIPKPKNPRWWRDPGQIYFLSLNGLSGYYPKDKADALSHWLMGKYSVAFKYSVRGETWAEVDLKEEL